MFYDRFEAVIIFIYYAFIGSKTKNSKLQNTPLRVNNRST